MSKKSNQNEVVENQTTPMENVKQVADKKKENKKKKEKKPNVAKKKLKEIGSELKKVSWPSFSKVVKQTGVVFAVVLIFTAVLLGIDKLLGELFKLLISSLS